MAFIDFADLKTRISIQDAVEYLSIDMKQRGEQLRSSCPHCGGDDRTLVVTPSKNAYYCWSSKKGGDCISLVAHVLDIGVKEAAAKLEERYGTGSKKGTVPEARKSTVPEERSERRLQPLDYLQADHDKLVSLGVLSDTATFFAAGYAPKGIMRGRLAIPIHSRTGELVAYCGRAVSGESPTLTFPNGFRPEQYVFNAHRIEGGDLYLTRDPLDVLTAYENGVENVVSFLTDSITAEQLQILASLMDERGCSTVELF